MIIEPQAHLRLAGKTPAIEHFLAKVAAGANLTPHLSYAPHRCGFSQKAAQEGKDHKWLDKDFALTATGLHHFHLGEETENGKIGRTKDLLFAEVTRDFFAVVGMFDHHAFRFGTPEHRRLLAIDNARRAAMHADPDTVYTGPIITTSGHMLHVVRFASHCAHIVRHLDGLLESKKVRADLYLQARQPPAENSKWEWHMNHLDLELRDWETQISFNLARGWN